MPRRWRIQTMSHAMLRVENCWRPLEGNEAGDFAEVVDLRDGRAVAIIGDVAGYGKVAARRADELQEHFRSAVREDVSPAAILRSLDRVIEQSDPEYFVTCACVLIDPTAHRAETAVAGHPPMVYVDGTRARLVDPRPGPPLGLADRRDAHPYELSPDAGLILYTDGLIERRGESLDEAFALIVDAAEHLHNSSPWAPQIARRVTERFGQPPDDATIVTVRISGSTTSEVDLSAHRTPVRIRAFIDPADLRSQRTMSMIRELAEVSSDRYELEVDVVDVTTASEEIEREGVMAIPMIVREEPGPVSRVVGVPRSVGDLAASLDLLVEEDE